MEVMMSRKSLTDVKQLFRDLKQIPLLETCRIATKANDEFYAGLRLVRDSHETIWEPGVGSLYEIVRDRERQTLAYAPRGSHELFKANAANYADSLFPGNSGHPAERYANAEVRVRGLEISCLDANLDKGHAFLLLSNQREAEFHAAVQSWSQLLRYSSRISNGAY